jgi:prepilin-type N-terminal cleavage/methylation domain-containing protein
MSHQPRRGEQGFTLIELLISIVVSGIVMSALVTGFIVILRGSAGAHDRFVASNGSQTLATYFTSDVQSANPTTVSAAAVGTGCSASSPPPAGSTNLLRMQWAEMTTATKMTAFSVSYRTEPVGSDWRIRRYYCTAAQDPVSVTADALLLSANPASHVMATSLSSPTLQTALTDGGTTINSFTITSATASFSAADVGQSITGAGIPAGTTVAALVNSSTVTISAKATATATGVSLTLNRYAFAAVSGRNIAMVLYSSVSTGQTAPYGYRLSADMRKSADQAFTVAAASPQTAGTAFTVNVKALKNGLTDTTYAGTVHFTSTDPQAVLPADYTFVPGDSGVHNFTNAVTLKNAPSQAVTATDTTKAWMAGSATVNVTPGPMNSFSIGAPTTTVSGVPFTATVKALDLYGNTATGYTGTVHFTSTDPNPLALLPGNYTFVAGDAGVHTFTNGVTLRTSPSQMVTVNDTVQTLKTGTATVSVTAASASNLTVSAPASATAGTPISVTVTAKDAGGSTVTGYTGRVHFTSTDGAATLPADYTFLAADNGSHSFSVTLNTAGSRTVTATDTTQSTVTGTSGTVTVSSPSPSSFGVSAPSTATAGTPISVMVTAKDSSGNTLTSFTGSQTLTWSGPHNSPAGTAPSYPTSVTFTAGVGIASITLYDAETTTLTATQSGVAGISGNITVSAGSFVGLYLLNPDHTVSCGAIATTYTCTVSPAVGNNASITSSVMFSDGYGNSVVRSGSPSTISLSTPSKGSVSPGSLTIPANGYQSSATFTLTKQGSNTATTTISYTSGGTTYSLTLSST